MRVMWLYSVIAVAVFAGSALAQNPSWPPPIGTTPEQLRDPAFWPDDHAYGYDINGDAPTCSMGSVCWDGRDTGGQWNWWSWTPPEALERASFRTQEATLGAGTWTDMAWQFTVGEPSVIIAVLDSGIRWDRDDLTNQFFLNTDELGARGLDPICLPDAPPGHMGDPIDLDGDGVLRMKDWFVGKTPEEAMAIRMELDSRGNMNGLADPGDLITICSDETDDDTNGYIDDISGWDFLHNDNDPSDDTNFGHGSGEARDSMAEANNGRGDAGHCPGCRALMVRVGDSFVIDAQNYAASVIYAVDRGASVIQEALGSVNHTTYMRRANDYAYDNDVLIVASAADENSRHHNYPGTSNHTLYVHAVTTAGSNPQAADSYLAFNTCTNYGAQLVLSAPGEGCSSEAVGVTSGIAGLVASAARAEDRPGGPLDPPLRAEEFRQLILMNVDDIDIPESQPDHPMRDPRWYPSLPGWDQRFGYGRVNAYKAVVAVREGRIPPEVDIVSPDWFRVFHNDRTSNLVLRGRIAADRAPNFDYVIEWAPGIEPRDSEWQMLREGTAVTGAVAGELVTWDISGLNINNPGEVENRYTVTVRIRATAHYGGAIGDVVGEQRRAFAILEDEDLLPGFPIALGVNNPDDIIHAASGEGSPKLFNVDADPALEIVYADADGLLHVFNGDGTLVDGYPVSLGPLRGLDPDDPTNHLGARAYMSGAVPTSDVHPSVVTNAPAIGDLTGDGSAEIVVSTFDGDIFAFSAADGTPVAGFPVALPEVLSGDARRRGPTNPDSAIERGIFAAVTLYDLDNDEDLEIIVPAMDGRLYVFRADGTAQPGFPVTLTAPRLWLNPADAQPGRIVTAAAVGDVNGDGIPDIALGSNEQGSDDGNGAFHVIHGDGNNHAGGPEHANWPITYPSYPFLPLVGEGTSQPVSLADINGDMRPDLAVAGLASVTTIADGIQPVIGPGEDIRPIVILDANFRGALSNITDAIDRPFFQTFAASSFADMDQDGYVDFMSGGAGLGLAAAFAGGGASTPFNHQVGVWNTHLAEGQSFGRMLPGFPQRIEDYLFFVNPSAADVTGDGYPEIILGSGGYYVHAWDACGREAPGFPEFNGGWVTSSVALGDIDGDGMLEAVVSTRDGYLWAWNTNGPVDGVHPWPEYRHDSRNTGNYEEPLAFGVKTGTAGAIECPLPPAPDAGVDAGPDAGAPGQAGGGGCDCNAVPATSALWPALVVALVWWRRRRESGDRFGTNRISPL